MHALASFKVGEVYTNDQIRFSLDVENLGGIRPALDHQKRIRHVAVLTASEDSGRVTHDNPYRDRIEGDVLTYTAQGREGEQSLAGRNKRLVEQYSVPTPFYGFINIGKQTYRFLGLLELLRHYQELQTDRKQNIRKVWVFEFKIHSKPEVVAIQHAAKISAQILAESQKQNPLGALEREVVSASSEAKTMQLQNLLEVERVRANMLQFTPRDFEHFIKHVMELSGFVSVTVTRHSGDGGIDVNGYADETNDFFAGTHIQAQVKRWRHSVGSPEINSFRGALSVTAKGVFITTSQFTRAAIAEARHESKPSIALITGDKLASIVIERKISLP